MSTSQLHPLARNYLERLAAAAERLDPASRQELFGDLNAHVREATWPDMTDAEAMTALDRLGDPEDIVAAMTPAPAVTGGPWPRIAPQGSRGTHEWAAIILLLIGGFLWGIGWILGVVLLWTSNAWQLKDKLIGTFLIPGGLAGMAAVIVLGLFGVTGTSICNSVSPGPISVTLSPGGGSGSQTGNLFNQAAGSQAGSHAISTAATSSGCGSAPSAVTIVLFVIAALVLLIIPILTAIHLARQAANQRPTIPASARLSAWS